MKNPQNLLFVVLFLLTGAGLSAQKGMEKIIVTSLNFEDDTQLQIDLCGEVELAHWKEDYIGVVVYVSTNVQNEETMSLIVRNDRYHIDATVTADNITTIKCPHLRKQIKVNRIPLQENIRYKLFIPQYAKVQMPQHNKALTTNSVALAK